MNDIEFDQVSISNPVAELGDIIDRSRDEIDNGDIERNLILFNERQKCGQIYIGTHVEVGKIKVFKDFKMFFARPSFQVDVVHNFLRVDKYRF